MTTPLKLIKGLFLNLIKMLRIDFQYVVLSCLFCEIDAFGFTDT